MISISFCIFEEVSHTMMYIALHLSRPQVAHTHRTHNSGDINRRWKVMSSGQPILATCADDRTVRVRDGQTFELIHVLSVPDNPRLVHRSSFQRLGKPQVNALHSVHKDRLYNATGPM